MSCNCGSGLRIIQLPGGSGDHVQISGIDFQPTANPGEFTVAISWVDENGIPQTTDDPTPVQILDQAAVCTALGDFLTVSAGTTADPAAAATTADVGCGDSLHFWSSDSTILLDVTQGSAIADIRLNPTVISGLAHTAITGIDLAPTANANEFTVSVTWTDEDGISQTTSDPTPITVAAGEDYATVDLASTGDRTHTWTHNQTEQFDGGSQSREFEITAIAGGPTHNITESANGRQVDLTGGPGQTASEALTANNYSLDITNGAAQTEVDQTGGTFAVKSEDLNNSTAGTGDLSVGESGSSIEYTETNLLFNGGAPATVGLEAGSEGSEPELYIKTNNVADSSATAGQVLSLVDPATGRVEYVDAAQETEEVDWFDIGGNPATYDPDDATDNPNGAEILTLHNSGVVAETIQNVNGGTYTLEPGETVQISLVDGTWFTTGGTDTVAASDLISSEVGNLTIEGDDGLLYSLPLASERCYDQPFGPLVIDHTPLNVTANNVEVFSPIAAFDHTTSFEVDAGAGQFSSGIGNINRLKPQNTGAVRSWIRFNKATDLVLTLNSISAPEAISFIRTDIQPDDGTAPWDARSGGTLIGARTIENNNGTSTVTFNGIQELEMVWSGTNTNQALSGSIVLSVSSTAPTTVREYTDGETTKWVYFDAAGDPVDLAAAPAWPEISCLSDLDEARVEAIAAEAGGGASSSTEEYAVVTPVPLNDPAKADPVEGDHVLQVYNDGYVISTYNGGVWTNTALMLDETDPASTELGNLIIEGDDGEEYALPLQSEQCYLEVIDTPVAGSLFTLSSYEAAAEFFEANFTGNQTYRSRDVEFDLSVLPFGARIKEIRMRDQRQGNNTSSPSFTYDGVASSESNPAAHPNGLSPGLTAMTFATSVLLQAGVNLIGESTVNNRLDEGEGSAESFIASAPNGTTAGTPLTGFPNAEFDFELSETNTYTLRTYSDGETTKQVYFDAAGAPQELASIPANWVACPAFDDTEMAAIAALITQTTDIECSQTVSIATPEIDHITGGAPNGTFATVGAGLSVTPGPVGTVYDTVRVLVRNLGAPISGQVLNINSDGNPIGGGLNTDPFDIPSGDNIIEITFPAVTVDAAIFGDGEILFDPNFGGWSVAVGFSTIGTTDFSDGQSTTQPVYGQIGSGGTTTATYRTVTLSDGTVTTYDESDAEVTLPANAEPCGLNASQLAEAAELDTNSPSTLCKQETAELTAGGGVGAGEPAVSTPGFLMYTVASVFDRFDPISSNVANTQEPNVAGVHWDGTDWRYSDNGQNGTTVPAAWPVFTPEPGDFLFAAVTFGNGPAGGSTFVGPLAAGSTGGIPHVENLAGLDTVAGNSFTNGSANGGEFWVDGTFTLPDIQVARLQLDGRYLLPDGSTASPAEAEADGWVPCTPAEALIAGKFADDTAAGTAGLTAGEVYQTDGTGAAPLNVAGILMVKQ